MTDVVENEAAATTEQAPKPEKKAAPQPHACLCSTFVVGEEYQNESDETVTSTMGTDCTQTTMSSFAQGHDARLVSFLVQAEFDGNKIWEKSSDQVFEYSSAAHALGGHSNALAKKAELAIERLKTAAAARKARTDKLTEARNAKAADKAARKAEREAAKAEKKAADEAAKANQPRKVAAEVREGSQEGDTPNGLAKIKIGRYEYEATIDEAGTAEYVDNEGQTVTREFGAYRLLTPAATEESVDVALV